MTHTRITLTGHSDVALAAYVTATNRLRSLRSQLADERGEGVISAAMPDDPILPLCQSRALSRRRP